jgi:hypothetical protein
MSQEFPQTSADGTTDAEYRFGRPKVYLAPHELARLTLLRSRLGDTRAERMAHAAAVQAAPQRSSRSQVNRHQ